MVWIQEESTGRERHFPLALFRYKPRVQFVACLPLQDRTLQNYHMRYLRRVPQ